MRYPHDHEKDIIYFAKTNFRNQMHRFGIKTDDRRRHVYVIGKTGMGKTTLLENMILSDIYAGHGCCYIDPHGDTAEKLLDYIPSWRINDVVYFNPADFDYPIGFNILEAVRPNQKHLVAAGMMSVFKKIWENVWSARMEYILNNTILALMDTPNTTLLGINRMLSDAAYRKEIVENVKDPIVKQFWVTEFASYESKFASEAVAPIQNKVGQFLSASVMRNIVAQAKSTLDLRGIMDDQKILIVNLAKGRIGEDAMRLLGGMIVTKLSMAAMERVEIPENERQDFYLYVDEFQNFAVESFASILSEARKYRLNLIMAHQYISQLDYAGNTTVRDAVFGNVGTIITFRVGSPDATFMEDEFTPRFLPEDLINLPKFQIYLKLMIDGITSSPFSALTLPPIAQKTSSAERVITQSRERYAGNRAEIEEHVATWSGFGEGVDLTEKYKEVKDKKEAAKKARYSQEYSCTRCGKTFAIPVELDRSRPIYCEECMPIIKEEREKGRKSIEPRPPKKTVDVVPKIAEGAVVEKEVNHSVSLNELHPPVAHEPNMAPVRTEKPAFTAGAILSAPTSVPLNANSALKKKRRRHKKKVPTPQTPSESSVSRPQQNQPPIPPTPASRSVHPGQIVTFKE
jgi:DNA-directed RNA polymerase subunit RPC12/RpoP